MDRTRDIRLEMRSDPRLLGSIRCLVRTWLESLELAEGVAGDVVLAVDEACSNAIRHAYGGPCDEIVVLTLKAAEDHLEVEVRDEGVPCPARHHARRCLGRPDTGELRPGGLGVQLMHEVFDEVRFAPGARGGNRVTMRLRRTQ